MIKYILVLSFIVTGCSTYNGYRSPNSSSIEVGEIPGGGYIVHVKTAQDFFKYMDLDSIYISAAYDGSPGYFVFSLFDKVGDKKDFIPVVGVYFKGMTKLTSKSDYDNSAAAKDVSKGYSCTTDEAKETAEMNVKKINVISTDNFIKKTYDKNDPKMNALLALNEHMLGFRIIDLNKSDYFGRCDAGNIFPNDLWNYGTVFTLEWKNKADFYANKKADTAHVDIRPGGYARFSFDRSSTGKIINIKTLKDMYIKAGFIDKEGNPL